LGKWFDGILQSEPKGEFGASWKIDPPVSITKPCHSTGFCVYGTLVEEFPLHEESKKHAIQHGWVVNHTLPNGEIIEVPDLNRVAREKLELDTYACKVFGHDCPVYYMAEPLSELLWLETMKELAEKNG
jgi:hypothetical protein